MLFDKHFRREEEPWEVVDLKDVSPVPVWDEDEGQQLICLKLYALRTDSPSFRDGCHPCPRDQPHLQVRPRTTRSRGPAESSPIRAISPYTGRYASEIQRPPIRRVSLIYHTRKCPSLTLATVGVVRCIGKAADTG